MNCSFFLCLAAFRTRSNAWVTRARLCVRCVLCRSAFPLVPGLGSANSGSVALLATTMEGAGYLVEQPEMCWSYGRRRDRPFLDCLAELEAPVARLTGRGARAIVVAGMSQGGIAALAFGARRRGLAGIIALAPAGAPERLVTVFPQIAQSIAQARAMVATGRSDGRSTFNDLNTRGSFSINTTAMIYLSFFDPTGPANMLDNTSRLARAVVMDRRYRRSQPARAKLCLQPRARQPAEPLRQSQR